MLPQKIDDKSELNKIGKTLTKFRSIRGQTNISLIGNPWIDGIIWARGIPLSLSKLRINITYMPGPMVERILDGLGNKYDINISSEHEREDGTNTIYMNISSESPIFRNIPKIKSNRKVSLENNSDFIEGYLQAIMHSYDGRKDLRIYPVKNTWDDIIDILTTQKIEYVESSLLIYIKDPRNCTNPIITRYRSFFEKEDEYLNEIDEIWSLSYSTNAFLEDTINNNDDLFIMNFRNNFNNNLNDIRLLFSMIKNEKVFIKYQKKYNFSNSYKTDDSIEFEDNLNKLVIELMKIGDSNQKDRRLMRKSIPLSWIGQISTKMKAISSDQELNQYFTNKSILDKVLESN